MALASSCEAAITHRCICRCGGALHGAKRYGTLSDNQEFPDRTFFENLPESDPHHLPNRDEILARRKHKTAKIVGNQLALFPALLLSEGAAD